MFLALLAAASITCTSPIPSDGASLQCGRKTPVLLDGITVAAPLDTCASWDLLCPADPGTAARDHLAELTRGQTVTCARRPNGKHACTVAGRDLSCAMLADGHGRPVGKSGNCPPATPAPTARFGMNWLPSKWLILSFLVFVNLAGGAIVMLDSYRHKRGFGGVAERLLFMLALLGGGVGIVVSQIAMLRREEAGVSAAVAIVLGLQIGASLGLAFL